MDRFRLVGRPFLQAEKTQRQVQERTDDAIEKAVFELRSSRGLARGCTPPVSLGWVWVGIGYLDAWILGCLNLKLLGQNWVLGCWWSQLGRFALFAISPPTQDGTRQKVPKGGNPILWEGTPNS